MRVLLWEIYGRVKDVGNRFKAEFISLLARAPILTCDIEILDTLSPAPPVGAR